MNELDRAWLLGLLEGEGWFGTHSDFKDARHTVRRKRAAVELMMTDEDVVAAAARLMGGSYRVVKRNRPDHYKVTYICRITGTRAIALMRDLLPSLSARRAARIREILAELG